MKKIISLLAVLALVGCEGSGNNNNNQNPNDPNNPGNGNNGNDNGNGGNNGGNNNGNGNGQTVAAIGKWTVGQGVTFNGEVQGIDFNITQNSITQTVKCNGNQNFTVTVKANVTATQIKILETKQSGTQTCPAGLGQSTANYAKVDDNNIEIDLGEQGVLPLVRVR